jgi:hypothetical protein
MKNFIKDVTLMSYRVDTNKKVSPIEIVNLYTQLISYILEKYKIKENDIIETMPKTVFIINHNLWASRDRYLKSVDVKRNRIGDHNKAYHNFQLTYLTKMAEKIKSMENKL